MPSFKYTGINTYSGTYFPCLATSPETFAQYTTGFDTRVSTPFAFGAAFCSNLPVVSPTTCANFWDCSSAFEAYSEAVGVGDLRVRREVWKERVVVWWRDRNMSIDIVQTVLRFSFVGDV